SSSVSSGSSAAPRRRPRSPHREPRPGGGAEPAMTPDVSVIVVNHRSAGESAACLVSAREAFAREAIAGEVVLVDCGSGADEVARLAALAADVFLPLPENRGYAGGLNAGLARARGKILLLCNADVVFLPGAMRALAAAAGEPGVGAAAPLAFWD